ncbi:BQ2448_2906 [Microbotryum intermedium]|uniref:BQ2448_2906 protein n=1 Tax=Microbotryum intermedium TaxID=269621 RepID=A0A238FJG2_9BASI|nr:BQ2448_2906 [Microbotryum intermedium]
MAKLKRARSRSRSLDRDQGGGDDSNPFTSTSKRRHGQQRLRFKQQQQQQQQQQHTTTTPETALTPIVVARRAGPVQALPLTILPTLPTLEGSLAEEILLRCLSYLDVHDVLSLATVSSGWYRLAHDNQLWKHLYTRTYAPLAASQFSSPLPSSRPWKELYKISFNWRQGHARTSVLRSSVRKAVLPPLPPTINDPGDDTSTAELAAETPSNRTLPRIIRPFASTPTATTRNPVLPNSVSQSDTLVQFYHNFYFIASRSPHPSSLIPPVQVQQALPDGSTHLLGEIVSPSLVATYQEPSSGFTPAISITSIQLDEARNTASGSGHHARLAVFLSTGQFSLFSISLPTSTELFEWREVHTSPLTTASGVVQAFDPVALAKYHGSLLVTCSRSFVVRFYHIVQQPAGDTSGESLVVIEASKRLQTSESWAPVSLSLEKLFDLFTLEPNDYRRRSKGLDLPQVFKLVLAFATPIFPDSWSAGVQQFDVTLTPHQGSLDTSGIAIKWQHAVARLAEPTFSSSARPQLSSPRPSLVTAIEHLGDHVVTSRADNTLDVYLLTADPKTGQLDIQHVKTLFGHTARVLSLALVPGMGGHCSASASATSSSLRATRERALPDHLLASKVVSASEDGKVKIWDLGAHHQSARRSKGVLSSAPIDVRETDHTRRTPQDSRDDVVDRAQVGSIWAQLASKRSQKQRVTVVRVALDEEKIVTVVRRGRAVDDGEESNREEEMIRILRFD